jgi:hypothetical protein
MADARHPGSLPTQQIHTAQSPTELGQLSSHCLQNQSVHHTTTAHVKWLLGIERALATLKERPVSWLDRSPAETDALVPSDVEGMAEP